MQEPTRYDERQREKEAKKAAWQKELGRKVLKKRLGWTVVIVMIIAVFAQFIRWIATYQPYIRGPIHWHEELAYKICGRDERVRESVADYLPIHGHNDGKIHMEFAGSVGSPDDIMVGQFFKDEGIPFSPQQVGPWKAGEPCPGKATPGHFRILIAGKENTEWGKHVMKDGEKMLIIYE